MGKAGPGYRKPKTKKYFTKKDIISTSIIAAVVIAAIVIISIVISNDDFIRTKDGQLQMEDNWIISNYSDNSSKYMYYKLGEVGDIEGYTLGEGSAQSAIKVITADDENAEVPVIYIGTFEHNYATAADAMVTYYSETTGPIDTTVCGRDAKYITSFTPATEEEPTTEEVLTEMAEEDMAEETPAEETPAEETASEETASDENADEAAADEDLFVMIAYVDYDEDHCIYIQLNADRELAPEECEAYLKLVADQITLVER